MLHAECKPKYFENQDVLEAEPSSKRMKSTEEPYGKSYEGLQRLHEEIHVKKTHSGFIPLSLSDDEKEVEVKREKTIAEVLNPFNKEISGKKSSSTEPSGLVKKAEITRNECFITYNTDVANNGGESNLIRECKNKDDTELYSTSKAFIGPIYKCEADRQHDQNIKYINKNCPAGSNTLGRNYKKKMAQAASGDVPKLEDELLQFYTEIDQLESSNSLDVHLQVTEANSPWQPKEYNKLNQIGYINYQEWSYKTSLKGKDEQCFYNESSGHSTDNKQYSFNDPSSHRTDKEQSCHNGRGAWEAEQPYNKRKDSRFWNDSVSHFRHSWQPAHSFIIPCSSSSQLTAHFNFQGSKSFSLCSDRFKSSNVEQLKRVNFIKNSSTYEQSNKYSNNSGTHSMQTLRNECNVPEGYMVNSFCETQTNCKVNRTYYFEGSNIVPQQYVEDKICEFKKQLLILRGLPGSGKTTLSHILLGQSHNGIVFSTDDYFQQINGCWAYNVTQLGAAHEWNQNRAKEAMDLGRSPVIIDNTNTQAWEMKPYVEAALEKGYHVEFYEPDTWWKFIPKELEKRNEHGVSCEKIVQMLERYEFQISIPIVMNSVPPFPQTPKRPYPQKRQRELVIKKKSRLHEMKQRRKRKNRKLKRAVITSVDIKSVGRLIPRDEDLLQSGQENSSNGKSELTTSNPNEAKVNSEDCSVNYNSLQLSELKKKDSPVSGLLNPEPVYKSLKAGVTGDGSMSQSMILNENMAEQMSKCHLPNRIKSIKNDILEHNSQNSSPKLDQSDTGKNTVLTDKESKNTSVEDRCDKVKKNETLSKKEETSLSYQHRTSKRNEINSWAFFSFKLADIQAHSKIDKNESHTWPEDIPSMLERRPEKMGGTKKVHSDTTAELIEHKKLVKESGSVLLHKNDITDGPPPLSPMENNPMMLLDKTEEFVTECGRKVSIASVGPKEEGKCKKIFKLAPNFDLPRHIPVKKDQKALNDIHAKTERKNISNIEIREKNQYLHNSKGLLSNYNIVLESSNSDDHQINQLTEEPLDISTKEPALPVQICVSTSLSNEQQIVEFDQIAEINANEMTSPDASTTQPDILCAVKVIDECCTDSMAKNTENTPQISENEQTMYSQIKGDQDSLNARSSFLKLPLSLGFALQLVELFGFPGVPLDTLLPDDYVVPLDWATSKEIYLQWKSSVEKKQEKCILKENSFPVDIAALQGSAEDAKEKISPEVNPKTPLGERSQL